MVSAQWARLRQPADCGLRLGAWYPVVGMAAREIQVRVHGQVLRVPRALVELRRTPPREWTVVRRAFNAARMPPGAREGYLVCPNCRYRESLPEGAPATLRCARCNEAFPVAWDGAATGGSRPASDTFHADARVTRRRGSSDRRSGLSRRSSAERRVASAAWPVERRHAARRLRPLRRLGRERRSGGDRRRKAAAW